MSDSKKRRMSLLDGLAKGAKAPDKSSAPSGATAPAPATAMMTTNRALRSARDAVDSHTVWDLDPHQIEDSRPEDRLDHDDVVDLRDAIEANGQTVPILVRRHPSAPDRYLLVYGRRRLEAIRNSDKVPKVRALIATMDDHGAIQAQISENMARRDLSFIEKALFARRLVDQGFGTQAQVAEVLTVTKSAISMALAIVDMVGTTVIEAIGPAHGVGRPRWEALGKSITETGANRETLAETAAHTYERVAYAPVLDGVSPDDPSVAAFEAVAAALAPPRAKVETPHATKPKRLKAGGTAIGTMRRSKRGLVLEIEDGGFADWVEAQSGPILQELHAQWKTRAEE